MGKLITYDMLSGIREKHPNARIVHCHGVFDLFHVGHLLHLKSARRFGDILVVTVTPDQFVNKGPGRPRFSEQERAMMVVALEVVDYVCINRFPKAIETIQELRPHIFVKGPDYRNKELDVTGAIQEEEDAVRSVGGELVFTDDRLESSSQLLNQFFGIWDSDQRAAIEDLRACGGCALVLDILGQMERLKVLVVGEPIVDSYVFCHAEAISSKSPTISARFLYQEDYPGGSLAVANHLSSLGCQVTLLITDGQEAHFDRVLKNSLAPQITIERFPLIGSPTPHKTRFIQPFGSQRMFELINVRADQWLHNDPTQFIHRLEELACNHDLCLVADFGHGLFEEAVQKELTRLSVFVCVNVQTNSGNLGFNPFTKHHRFDYLSIDERECRLATHDRFTPIAELARQTVRTMIRTPSSITLGAGGSTYFDANGSEFFCPTFFREVVDSTGAGDAYFTITSLLTKLKVASPVVPFLGNCFAGLKTRIIGNKSAVSKTDLVRTIQALFK